MPFFPPAQVVEGIKSVLCSCVCVSALPAEPFDIRTQNSVEGLTLIISRMSLKVEVKVASLKNMIFGFSDGLTCAVI